MFFVLKQYFVELCCKLTLVLVNTLYVLMGTMEICFEYYFYLGNPLLNLPAIYIMFSINRCIGRSTEGYARICVP